MARSSYEAALRLLLKLTLKSLTPSRSRGPSLARSSSTQADQSMAACGRRFSRIPALKTVCGRELRTEATKASGTSGFVPGRATAAAGTSGCAPRASVCAAHGRCAEHNAVAFDHGLARGRDRRTARSISPGSPDSKVFGQPVCPARGRHWAGYCIFPETQSAG